MDKKRMRTRARELLVNGMTRSKVFEQLSGQGVKDAALAYFIASYVDPARREVHRGKIRILIAIMLIQALLGFVVGYGLGARTGPEAAWIVGGLIAAIPLWIGWGFHKNWVGAYNAYIVLTIIQGYQMIDGFSSAPIATSVGVVINVAILALVCYVREKLFPGFVLTTPKKMKGRYVFTD
jgi:O-antigen/teichoic acid export membrane protein